MSTTHYPRGLTPSNFPPYLYPHGSYSLSGIALRSFVLGLVCAVSLLAIYLFRHSFPQLPFFVAALSLFHFLEFWITAEYNTRRAKTDAFILTNNGAAYQFAHTAAILECALEAYFLPGWKSPGVLTGMGLVVMVLGQVARTLAMKHAGSNFSHYVASRREDGHTLVQTGVYAYLRHPSYFGYWWWAVGTQIMMANPVCLVGFGVVLWRFFSRRIEVEEEYLVEFFGEEYEEYRGRSWVGIPLIWR